jgi:hypothetical protein
MLLDVIGIRKDFNEGNRKYYIKEDILKNPLNNCNKMKILY